MGGGSSCIQPFGQGHDLPRRGSATRTRELIRCVS
uniref:Uncharacterized protein n=1 Tax=Anopheles quadriannulatus TaxID=34691 RepID=A0A182XTV9_ANOQN